MAEQVQQVPAILRRKQVEARTGLRRSTIYAKVASGEFPAPPIEDRFRPTSAVRPTPNRTFNVARADVRRAVAFRASNTD